MKVVEIADHLDLGEINLVFCIGVNGFQIMSSHHAKAGAQLTDK
jgi:hypothetical protein